MMQFYNVIPKYMQDENSTSKCKTKTTYDLITKAFFTEYIEQKTRKFQI